MADVALAVFELVVALGIGALWVTVAVAFADFSTRN